MTPDRRQLLIAVPLATLAGYVDGVGFLQLGGFFVSFMSGNSTRLGASIALGAWQHVISVGLLLVGFVAGALLGSLIGHRAGDQRRRAVLAAVALWLALAILAFEQEQQRIALVALVIAMGTENAVLGRTGEAQIGVTYMTGALVATGRKLADALLHGHSLLAPFKHLLLWSGLTGGAIAGAVAWTQYGTTALWAAVALALLLAIPRPLPVTR